MGEVRIEDLLLSNRSKNQLIKNGYNYAHELKGLTDEDLEKIRNLGAKSIQEIRTFRDNMASSYGADISISKDVTVEALRSMEIERVINSGNITKVLKINNIKIMGAFLELSYEDIKKFRNVDDQSINEIHSICKRLREKINLVDRDLFKLVLKNPKKPINRIICENIPKSLYNCTMNFFFENKFVNEINIEEHDLSNKEKKLLLTHSLNKIDSLLSTSYYEILENTGISNKTVNVVLEKILKHVVVQNKHEIFIGDVSRLYLNESVYSYLLVMREKLLDNILRKLSNSIDTFFNSEQFHITYKVDLLTENKFIEKSVNEMVFSEVEGQEIVYSFAKKNSYIYIVKMKCVRN